MKPLEMHLGRHGYRTLNWGYPSIWGDIQLHAKGLEEQLLKLNQTHAVEHIRLVTHSMGGIVARQALAGARFEKLRSLVMLGPPNRGSRVAAILARRLGWFCRSLTQLSDGDDSFVNRLSVPEGIEIGVIAALYDRVVAVENTHIPTELDHRIVPSGHTSMLFRRDVADHVAVFLQTGHFADEQHTQHRLLRSIRSTRRSTDELCASDCVS